MRLIPMSRSELAWERFYDPDAQTLGLYRQWMSRTAGASISQIWCRVDVLWERGKRGEPVVRLTRKLPRAGIGAPGCTHVRFWGAICPSALLRLTVNGRTHDLHGNGEPAYYTLPIRGKRIRSLAFELVPQEDGTGAASLIWLALVDMKREKERLAQRGQWDGSWYGLLRPASERVKPEVGIGILFGQEDVPALRRKAVTRLYRPWMAVLRKQARTLLKVQPESLIGRFACPPLHYTRPGERKGLAGFGRPRVSWESFHQLALVGLLDEDMRMLRHAARWMLSLASCEYWYNDFAGELPGTRWHHRSFTESDLSRYMALSLDWAGAELTPQGKNLVRDAIARRGLPRIQLDFIDPEMEYTRAMNQGIHFNSGRILGLLALCKEWSRAAVRLKEAQDDAWEMFESAVTSDAGTIEGPGYWRYTMTAALPTMIALARYRGCEPADLMPARMRHAPEYPGALTSVSEAQKSLPISDSRGAPICIGSLTAMLHQIFPSEQTRQLVAWGLRDPAPDNKPELALIFGPPRVPKPRQLVPEFSLLRGTGHALVCRTLRGLGQVRLQFYGAPAVRSIVHSHEDRGNILLEAGGEWVFVDRGIGSYSNPSRAATWPEAHNLFIPDTPDGSVPRQIEDHAQAVLPKASYRNGRFRATMDTTAAWPEYVKHCKRTIVSPSPGLFEIIDEVETTRPLGGTFHLHTPLKAHRHDDGWLLKGKRVQVLVEPQWTIAGSGWAEEDMEMGEHGRDYGHLQLRVAPARRHRLVTRLSVTAR